MANLDNRTGKRRSDKDLNHDNWDDEDPPEEKGEFKRASDEDMKNRKVLKPRRKLTTGNAEGTPNAPANPFSSFSFGAGASTSAAAFGGGSAAVPAFTFGLPLKPVVPVAGAGGACDTATPGGTGSLFKMVGITPSAEPPTKASADSSTTDAAEPVGQQTGSVVAEAEVGSPSESEGITEESSNSSSLPWNVSARQRERDDANAVDSNNIHGSGDLNNPSWLDADDVDDKEASAASAEPVLMQPAGASDGNERRTHPATSSAPADSSESSSGNSNHNPVGHFNFGNSFTGGAPGGSLFQQFHPSSTSTSNQTRNHPTPTSVTSPESSGLVVRSSLEDDSADYENDTTSSSNKLPSEGNDNEDYVAEFDAEDREADAGGGNANEEREAEGVDS